MSEILTCTAVIYIVSIIGFMITFMFHTNLSLAIVAMINNTNIHPNTTNSAKLHQYNWSVLEKNYLLASSNVGYLLSEIISGRLSDIFGPKKVMGTATFFASLLNIIFPFTCENIIIAIITRFFTGVFLSPAIPSYATLIVNWLPPTDRTKSLAIVASFGLGVALNMYMSGIVVSYFGWAMNFYIMGVLGLVWTVGWFYLIYDKPEKHPRISTDETNYIKESMGEKKYENVPTKLPIKNIITSKPILVIALMRCCYGFCHFLIILQLPTYLNDILKFNTRDSGLFSALPFLGYFLAAVVACTYADKLLKSNRISKTNIRKIMECTYLLMLSFSMMCLALWGFNSTVAVVMFFLGTTSMGIKNAGHFANIVDVSPNFAGTLVGMSNTITSFLGLINTQICAMLTNNSNTFESWRIMFWIVSIFCLFCCIIYGLYASAEIQPWNSVEVQNNEERHLIQNRKKLIFSV